MVPIAVQQCPTVVPTAVRHQRNPDIRVTLRDLVNDCGIRIRRRRRRRIRRRLTTARFLSVGGSIFRYAEVHSLFPQPDGGFDVPVVVLKPVGCGRLASPRRVSMVVVGTVVTVITAEW